MRPARTAPPGRDRRARGPGDPSRLAADYAGRPQYLIGPELFELVSPVADNAAQHRHADRRHRAGRRRPLGWGRLHRRPARGCGRSVDAFIWISSSPGHDHLRRLLRRRSRGAGRDQRCRRPVDRRAPAGAPSRRHQRERRGGGAIPPRSESVASCSSNRGAVWFTDGSGDPIPLLNPLTRGAAPPIPVLVAPSSRRGVLHPLRLPGRPMGRRRSPPPTPWPTSPLGARDRPGAARSSTPPSPMRWGGRPSPMPAGR